MHVQSKVFFALVLAAVLAVGCSKGPEAPAAATPTSAGGAAEPAAGPPAGSKVVCHLNCSGTEASGYGATEEEARDDVSRYIKQNCNPDDGQYFVICKPVE